MRLRYITSYLAVLCCLIFMSSNSFAQERQRTADGEYAEDVIAPITTTGWYFGGSLGFNHLYGDMSDDLFYKKFFKETKSIVSLHAGKEITPWMALQLELVTGGLYAEKGVSASGETGDLIFKGNYSDVVVGIKIPVTRLLWPYSYSKFTGYFYGGLGLAFWNGEMFSQYSDEHVLSTGKGTSAVMPLGIGLQYDVSDKVSLFSEASARLVFSDNVDLILDRGPIDYPAVLKVGITYHFSRLDYYKAPIKKRREARSKKKKVDNDGLLLFSKKKEKEQSYEYDDKYDADKPMVMEYDKTSDIRKLLETNNTQAESIVTPQNIFEVQNQPRPKVQSYTNPKTVVQKPVSNWNPVSGDLVFRVQILATGVRKNMTSLYNKYGSQYEIFEYYNGSIYKYSMGKFKTYNEALNYSRTLHNKGIYDAFIVVFENGQQIRLTPQMKK